MKIVLIGGGEIPGWNFKTKDNKQYLYETKKIDNEIVKLSGKNNPKVLFVGTAKKDNLIYFDAIKNIYEKLNCTVEILNTMNNNIEYDYLEEKVLSANIIYIGGGNTKFMLQRWKDIKLDNLLKEAIKKDIVIAGFSAGAYAMCKYSYDLIEGLNILNYILCVHYNEKIEEKKKMFLENIKEKNLQGIALDNSVALVINNGTEEIIKESNENNAYKFIFKDNKIIEKKI